MQLKFLGAAGTVTGSSYLLAGSKGTKLLIDFGIFQGPKEISDLNRAKLDFNPTEVTAVLLTHAHLDHCGRLPLLANTSFSGNIYMTEPTRLLTELALVDAAKVAKEDRRQKPLFDEDQVNKVIGFMKVIDYHKVFSISEFDINYIDAGHILGSASIEIIDTSSNQKIVFSGDLGNSPEPLELPTEYVDDADFIVMESTYGGRSHSSENATQVIQKEINTVESFNSALLIPAFSLERTQVLLHMIDHLKKEGKMKASTPIYLDSPMAIKATYIYGQFPNLYNQELSDHNRNDNPFDFPGLTLVEKAKDSLAISETRGTKIIIAGSGMMNGGRILSHLINYLPIATTRLLTVGYQAEGTIGRKILDGAREVKVYGKIIPVNAKIRELTSISAHADEPKLINWLSKPKGVKKVFLIHGENKARDALRQIIKSRLSIPEIHLPNLNEEVKLD